MSPKKTKTLNRFLLPFWVWAIFFLALWEILLLAQNPGLMADDSGEMIAGSYCLGLPHPPGYPIFCLVGRLFSFVPIGAVAFRFNLFSALVGLAAMGFVMNSCWRLAPALKKDGKKETGIRVGALLLASLSLFFCRSFFSQCLTAKGLVYMLSFLLLSALVDLRVQSQVWSEEQKSRKKYFVLFLFLLGFSNHWQTEILLTPFILLWGFQERIRWDLKSAFRSASVALIALSAYLYLPLVGGIQAIPKWGNPVNLSEFLWVVQRKLSSGTETPLRGVDHLLKWGSEYGRLMVSDWTWPFLIVGIIGFIHFYFFRKKLFFSLMIFYFSVLAALVLVPRDEVIYLLDVYLLAIQGVFSVFVFCGLIFIVDGKKWRHLAWILLILIFGGLIWNAKAVLKSESKTNYTLMEDFGLNALKNLPSHAIFVMDGDHFVMPIWYERYVEGFRKDLVIEPGVFLFHPWGWKQLEAMDPEIKKATGTFLDFAGKSRALANIPGRPLFCSLSRNNLDPFLNQFSGSWAPQGLVLRYDGVFPENPDLVRRLASAERIRDFDDFKDSPGLDFSSNEIFRYYARQYYEAAQYFHGKKRDDSAVMYFARGAEIYPEAFALGDLGLLLEQEGFGALAEEVWNRGLQVDRNYYPTYFNLSEFYQQRGEKQKALDCCRRALALAPHSEKVELEVLESELSSGKIPVSVSPRNGKTPSDYQKLARQLDRDSISWLAKLALVGAAPAKGGSP